MTHWPPVKVACATWLCVAKRITRIASLNMKCRLCLKRCTLNFSLQEHLKYNEFVSDQKLLLIICTVPFPQDHGKAITLSYANGLYKAVSSQTVAWLSSKTRNWEKKPDAQWNEVNESRWYSRVVEPGTGLAFVLLSQSHIYCSLFPFQGKLVNRASWFSLERYIYVCVYMSFCVYTLLSRHVCGSVVYIYTHKHTHICPRVCFLNNLQPGYDS